MEKITIDSTVHDANQALRSAIVNSQEAIALPSGFDLHKITTHLARPNRQVGTFNAEQLDDVLAYYKAHKDADSRVFIDTKDVGLTCIIDFGNVLAPGHKEHSARWKANPSAVFQRLLHQSAWSQKDFAEFLEDYAVDLIALKGMDTDNDKIEYTKAVQAARSITLDTAKQRTQSTANFAASSSAMEQVSAKIDHGMPQYLKLVGPAYLGHNAFMEIPVYVAVGLRTGDDKIGFSTRIVAPENIRQQTAAALKAIAISATGIEEVLTGQFVSD